MGARPTPQEEQIHDLRLQIGRARRRLDRHLHAAAGETQRLKSWRSYVTSFPGSAALAALGVGLALSGGMKSQSIARWLGSRLLRQAWNSLRSGILEELRAVWEESAAKPQAKQGGEAKHE